MTIQHKNIAEADLHEPKGVSTAPANKVYVSNGSGSGSWQALPGKLYAEIYIDAGTSAQALAAASAYSLLNPTYVVGPDTFSEWTENIKSGLTTVPDNGEIVLSSAGVYLIEFWAVFDTAAIAAGSTYNFKFAINGSPISRLVSIKKTTAGAERKHVSTQVLLTATASDILSMYVGGDGTSSATNITVLEAGLIAIKLAD